MTCACHFVNCQLLFKLAILNAANPQIHNSRGVILVLKLPSCIIVHILERAQGMTPIPTKCLELLINYENNLPLQKMFAYRFYDKFMFYVNLFSCHKNSSLFENSQR